MLRGTYRDPDSGQTTLRKYVIEVWLPAQASDPITVERIRASLRTHILPGLGDRRLQELEQHPSLVQAWVSGLLLAPSSAARTFVTLSTIMRWAVRDKLISASPCIDIKLPKVTRRRIDPWPPETIAAVRAALSFRYRGLVDAGTGLGMRQSELFAMSVKNTDFLRRVVHVRVQVKIVGGRFWYAPPKGRKERSAPIARQTADALAAHLAAFPAVSVTLPWHEPGTKRHGQPHNLTLLFTTPDGRQLHRYTFNPRIWRPAVQAAGLPDDRVNGCHAMRHAYASTLIARGIDVRTVAEYLGHSDGGSLVLRTYSHLLPDAGDRTRRALEDALGGTSPVAGATGSI
jgi:integrase